MPVKTLAQQLFVHPLVQLDNVHRWNARRHWGFTEEDFAKVRTAPPRPRKSLGAVVLVPYLDTVQKTFDALSGVIASQHQQGVFNRAIVHTRSKPDSLRLLPGIEHRRGLEWVSLDLGAAPEMPPLYVRDPRWSPHAQVLAAAAHFPQWVRRMNGIDIPYVFITGYEARYRSTDTWHRTMSLSRVIPGISMADDTRGQGVLLLMSTYVGNDGDKRYASPEITGCNSVWDAKVSDERWRKRFH